MRVAVAGASGLLGSALVDDLRRAGDAVVRIGRGRSSDVVWDPVRQQLDARELEGVDVIVNLAGANIGERWSAGQKRAILESRVAGTGLLSRAAAALSPKPLFVSTSAVGYYGYESDRVVDENGPRGRGFLADVVQQWEEAAEPARQAGVRVMHPRFGVVMSPKGGALQKLLPPFRAGLGGKIGSGNQWMSWIALTDWVRALRFLMTRDMTGVVNVTSPNPVTNSEFSHTLARVLHRPALLTVPSIPLKLVYGSDMVEETLLGGQRVIPKRLQDAGFEFELAMLEAALAAELARG